MRKIIENIGQKVRDIPKQSLILVAIVLLGIFLRTYNFSQWMTFNPDQARDALAVQSVLNGQAPLPLLGPQAGNTAFKLGPMFYYFEIVGAKIFGVLADKMAYPDLVFSILSIPLFFVFLRKFFAKNASLMLAGLYAVSFFVITYSRFAFNPNSIPFFTLVFLWGLLEIINAEKKENYLAAISVGVAMGVGVQLHALVFLAMPISALLVLIWMSFRKIFVWRSALLVLAFFALVNGPQIFGETKTGGANLSAFFSGAGAETKTADNKLGRNLSNDFICHIQGFSYIASSVGGGDKCDLMKLSARIEKKGWGYNIENIATLMLGGLIMIGGMILWAYYLRREVDPRKRNFLILVSLYLGIIFMIFIPVSASISIRYFITIVFAPYVFLGLWWKFFEEKFSPKVAIAMIGVMAIGLGLLNFGSLFSAASQYRDHKFSTSNVAVFGEVQALSEYMFENSQSAKKIYLIGKRDYLKRFYMPLNYFASQKGIELIKIDSKKNLQPGIPMFYVAKKQGSKKISIKGYEVLEFRNFGNISLTRVAN